ncbi:MAG: hypothetical protein BGO05_09850 [Rhizobiales bacterium 63-7]|nr:MAG: hypothetical protein BGO05_09850 [Rhizobiales bacterium 63-7]
MIKFTLDTNCLIAVEDGRAERSSVLSLIDAQRQEAADLAMVASSAAERQIGGGALENIEEFRKRMETLGFGGIELLKPIAVWNLSYWDFAIYPSDEAADLQTEIFSALFPSTNPKWPAYAGEKGVDPDDIESREGWKWRNRFLDAQAMWGHIFYGRDVFVTSDRNFSKRLSAHSRFRDIEIATPSKAASLL